jgi:hypothetical protein
MVVWQQLGGAMLPWHWHFVLDGLSVMQHPPFPRQICGGLSHTWDMGICVDVRGRTPNATEYALALVSGYLVSIFVFKHRLLSISAIGGLRIRASGARTPDAPTSTGYSL